jgi:uncharacterized protein YecE (DUF72 family)
MASNTIFHIGCQSWGYDDWITSAGGRTIFYPRATKRDEMLGLYSQIFDTIEVDSTLYGVPAATTIEGWYAETPSNFVFSLKFPREVTHDNSLAPQTYPVVSEFVERAALLKEKLGLLLIQMPASFEATRENGQTVREFLASLPGGFRYAMEFRNDGWFVDWTFEELETAGVSLCLVEGRWVDRELVLGSIPRLTTPFGYIRVMGERDLPKFDRIYRPQDDAIDRWITEIENLDAAEIFIYIDNYFEGHAPATAAKFKERLNLPIRLPGELETQGTLF